MQFYMYSQTIAPLGDAEEARLYEVLAKIREQVNERRIMMYQYFKDYDRVSGPYVS